MQQRHLKITSIPPGEAPLWVREKWVGLALPIAERNISPRAHWGFGVLSVPNGLLSFLYALLTGKHGKHTGYIVEANGAVSLLAESSPEAARWWRENTASLLKPGMMFVFDQRAGHILDPDA